jgi:hypothetical protein
MDLKDGKSEQFRLWVRQQVELARFCFKQGKTYIDALEVLRCKLAGVWYCARFERVLDAIEQDDYRLRAEYHQRHALKAWMEMALLGIVVTLKHFARRIWLFLFRLDHQAEMDSRLNMSSSHIK